SGAAAAAAGWGHRAAARAAGQEEARADGPESTAHPRRHDTPALAAAAREKLGQLGGRALFQLVVAAVRRLLVGPPADEVRRMAGATALQMVVGHFADALDPQPARREVPAAVPARTRARPALA